MTFKIASSSARVPLAPTRQVQIKVHLGPRVGFGGLMTNN
jgi:hypothetical protein